jgi:hypothetical protein
LERPTEGSESGSWRTPHGMGNDGDRANGPSGNELGFQVMRTWPTTKAADGRSKGNGGNRHSPGLDQLSKGWPTPAARDWKDSGTEPAAQARKSPCLPAAAVIAGLPDQDSPSTDGKPRGSSDTPNPKGSLNSFWVLQLQGLPSDWCDVFER